MQQYGQARGKLPDGLGMLMTSQMQSAIDEANLGITDTEIARRYYIDRMAQMDIACLLGCDRSTVSRRLKGIAPRVTYAAGKITMPQ